MNSAKSDYFESLTSFHKPIWISEHEALGESHLGDSDMMEVDEEFFFNHHRIVDENEKTCCR